MSNPSNTNGIINNCNNLAVRDGTRVVLREITATLQNSPPMQSALRKAVSNTPPGKTEHEVKVQFTREFVDAAAPNSRPESLSSASSFQSLASTLSTKSGIQSNSAPITPQRAANTSYIDKDIPGLDDLIAACENIQFNDKLDADEPTETYHSIADSTLTITACDNSFQLPNTVQNLSQEEAFSSTINGTHDLTSDYKEAFEYSINSNDTREIAAGLEDKLQNSNSDSVKDFLPKKTEEELITNHIQDSPDIPQLSANNSLINETRDLSLKSDIANGFCLDRTLDLAPTNEQPENNTSEIQDHSPGLNASEKPHSLNQTNEIVGNCNSTFNNFNSSKSDVLNLTHDISNDDKNVSIDCNSQNTADTRPGQSLNELSTNEADRNVSSLNNPLNLPPESDTNISTSNIESFNTPEVVITEASIIDESLNKESDSSIIRSVEVGVKDFEEKRSWQKSSITSDQCIPDSSTDHLPEIILGTEAEIANSLSSCAPETYENSSADFLKESVVQEETEQISDHHNVSTSGIITEEKSEREQSSNELEPVQSQQIPDAPKSVEPEVLNSTEPASEFEKSKGLPDEPEPVKSQEIPEVPEAAEPEVLDSTKPELKSEKREESPGKTPVDQLTKTPEKQESPKSVLPVAENIVPCSLQGDLPNSFQEFRESKSEELPPVVINITPFPGYNCETDQNSTFNLEEETFQNGSRSSVEQDSNETIILKEDSLHSISSDGASEAYNAFQPVKQSTSLNSDCNFKKLELAAQGIAEEIRNKSLEFGEDSDQFFTANPDLFLDTASLDFFLTRNNSKNSVRDLRTESLYVKFDPLVSNVSMLPQGPPQVVDGDENAKNSIPQPTLDTPKRNPALAAIDRLLFYSPAGGTPNKVEDPPKIEEKIVEHEIPEAVPIVNEIMAKELELVRSTVVQLDSQIEKQKREHEEELEKQRLKYKELELELAREVQKKNEMTMVMDEYEKSLSRHMTDRERERASFEQEKARLQEELQAANHHLGNTEAAFNDVHSKYERLKNVVSAYKSNEDVLKESVHENVETIKTLEARYEQLKSHAMTQLEKANLELEAIRKQHETETVRLQAMIRKAELKSNSLAEMVEQKSKENKELAEILDEVIARVGRNPE